ncbi:hypothetical protein ID866_9950 [Astraeus odoratus]|nr:hypothetical protein ID866_9950 [Astraeus odoratus]
MLGISTDFGSTISIISDWMGMGDASTYIQNAENDPRSLLLDIACGLHYLHSHQLGPIFHGDLKGQNVMVSDERRALLGDFGFSTLNKSTFSMTTKSPHGGSFPWMAPELMDDYTSSSEGDVWAFGMTVLELFTRQRPFHECVNPTAVTVRVLRGPLPDRPTEASTCCRMTNEWWELCSSCWNRNPSSRPQIANIEKRIKGILVRTLW